MKTIIVSSLIVCLSACSRTDTVPVHEPNRAKPATTADQSATPVVPSKPDDAPDRPPAGFNGLPWRACAPSTGSRLCTDAAFRTTTIGQMEDNSSVLDITKRRIYFTHTSCEAGACRAYWNNGHQCRNGDTIACNLLDSTSAGTVSCVNGAWGSCTTGSASNAAAPSELETASN